MPNTWLSEFGKEYEVPNPIKAMCLFKVADDYSWHNDMCPSFGKTLDAEGSGDDIRIWVEHPQIDMREHQDSKRFIVSVNETKNVTLCKSFETDEVNEAIKHYLDLLVEYKSRI